MCDRHEYEDHGLAMRVTGLLILFCCAVAMWVCISWLFDYVGGLIRRAV